MRGKGGESAAVPDNVEERDEEDVAENMKVERRLSTGKAMV